MHSENDHLKKNDGGITDCSTSYTVVYFKVFPDGLMDDMMSKNISNCTVSDTALPMKTDLHFQPILLPIKFSLYLNSTLLFFLKNCSKCCIDTFFLKDEPHVENTFKYINTYAYVFFWSV